MKKLTKIQILFIRACKSKKTTNRVIRLYKHFYWSKPDYGAINYILMQICKDSNIDYSDKLYYGISPVNDCFYDHTNSYEERVCAILISLIRLSSVGCFNGFIKGLKWRNNGT